ncbi:unnamed protein product [Brassicogethes aeneus]|uniref:Cationic amino acid transporter C-terminal domain-containing protein n=1 Tax=Brassicogethes aeneus TaxID=1431903 RepID=A0A9P0FI30_BRAAE|nr:unnamed protein product [Brassicogethes aeneus]
MGCWGTTWKILTRRKILDPVAVQQSQLSRVLTSLDLTALGVGSTLGVGVYVIAGKVAKDTAGPAVIISFLIAAIASIFAGLCYAEFGARAPRAGSAYIYTYVCIGEFVAFVIGWNLILEYVIGSASVARGLSGYLDSLLNHTMQDAFIEIAPINVEFLAKYFDFFAFGVSVLLAMALSFGMKESSMVNNVVTFINIGVVIFTIIAGLFKADISNWQIQHNATNSTDPLGKGGFFPFGIDGVIKGAATCFYGFVGFDCIATTGEEVKNPKKAIPLSIILSLFIVFLSYFGTSIVSTLMIPYYEQDVVVPIPHAFEVVGWEWAKWIVAIGGIFGLCASLFGAMFPLPRIIYAMASDSLIFRFLGKVSDRFKSPIVGTMISGILTGIMAGLFDIGQLVDMMSIGTLMAYTIVAASVLLLRYTDNRMSTNNDDAETFNDTEPILEYVPTSQYYMQLFNCSSWDSPTKVSEKVSTVLVFLFCVFSVCIGLCALLLKEQIAHGEIWAIVLSSISVTLAVLTIISLTLQPTSKTELSFKVPCVPLIPALSILVNIYLMLMLDYRTWIRFGVWMAVGLPVYYFSLIPAETLNTPIKIYEKHKQLNGCDNMAFEFDGNGLMTLKKNKRKAPLAPQTIRTAAKNVLEDLDKILDIAEENLEQNTANDDNNNHDGSNLSRTSTASFKSIPESPKIITKQIEESQAPKDNMEVVSVYEIREHLTPCYAVEETILPFEELELDCLEIEEINTPDDESDTATLRIVHDETKDEESPRIIEERPKSVKEIIAQFGEKGPPTPKSRKTSRKSRADSFTDVQLVPIRRPSLEKMKEDLRRVKIEEQLEKALQNKIEQPLKENSMEKFAKSEESLRSTSFMLKNIKLKPTVKPKEKVYENDDKIPDPPSIPIPPVLPLTSTKNTAGRKLNRPTSFQLKNVKLKPTVNRKSEPAYLEDQDEIPGVSEENFVTNNKNKLSNFKDILNNTLSRSPGMLLNQLKFDTEESLGSAEIPPPDSVIDEHIDKEDAKNKLSEFLKTRPSP